jgi:phosphopantetheinyl transferase
VAGRVAAKRALTALTGVPPHEISVRSADTGEPLAEVPGVPGVRVSISHREGRAVAVAAMDRRVGVDLERIEPRASSFAETWLSPEERSLGAGPLVETLIWATKEAVLKWLGTGLRASPHHVRVTSLGDGLATVRLDGPLAARHAELGGAPLLVAWSRHGGDEVVVTVRAAA